MRLRLLAALAPLVCATPAAAVSIQGTFTGTVTESTLTLPELQPLGPAPGDLFSGTFRAEGEFRVADDGIGFIDGVGRVSFTTGALSDSVFMPNAPTVVDDEGTSEEINPSGSDTFGFFGEPASEEFGGVGYLDFDLGFTDRDGTALSGVTLPTSLDVAEFESAGLDFTLDFGEGGHAWHFDGRVDTLQVAAAIPEPTAALAFSIGVLALAPALRRGHRR